MPAARRVPFHLFPLAALLLLTLMTGCGGSGRAALERAADEYNAALPVLSELRATKAAGDHLVLASAFEETSSGALLEGVFPTQVLRLNASDGGHFEWAVFAFDAVAAEELVDVALTLTGENGSIDTVFAAVGDFSSGRWRISEAFSSTSAQADLTVDLDSATDLSPEGKVFVALIAPLGSEVLLGLLNFRTLALISPTADIQADLTSGDAPLQVNFDASASADADGEIVLYEWDSSGDGSFETSTGSNPLHQITYSSGGIFNAAVRVTDDDGQSATASVEVTVSEGGNIPPQAVLEADVTEGDGEAGFSVNFTSSNSSDSEGSITLFEWDLDSDSTTGSGGFEVSSPTADVQQVAYNEPGEFSVRLRVTDGGGLRRVDSVVIKSHGWVRVPVATLPADESASGFFLSHLGKFPAFSYIDGTSGHPVVARSSTKFGSEAADWTLTELEVNAASSDTSLALVAERPCIAFIGNGDLLFARSSTAAGDNPQDWTPIKLTTDPSRGISMTIVDGRPAVSAIDSQANEVIYLHSLSSDGADFADWQRIAVDDLVADTFPTALSVVDGNPAICWYDDAGGGLSLRYARSLTATGDAAADWSGQIQVSGQGSADTNAKLSLVIVEGKPAIGFAAVSQSSPGYAFSFSADGSQASDWQALSLEPSTGGLVGTLTLVDGFPAMIYEDRGAGVKHRLARSSTAGGRLLADWSFEDVTDGETIVLNKVDSSLTDVDGVPAMVFFDSGADQVIYAIRF